MSIKAYNEIEKKYIIQYLDYFIYREELILKDLETVFVEAYQKLDEIKDIKDMDTLVEFMDDFSNYLWKEVSTVKTVIDNVDKVIYSNYVDITINYKQAVKYLCQHVKLPKVINARFMLFTRRVNLIYMSTAEELYTQVESMIELAFSEYQNTAERLCNTHCSMEELSEKLNVELDTTDDRLYKIFNYKDMQRLAEDNGYILARTTGDHAIYKHIESFKILVIPNHNLGYGLMCKIQKQIKENKVV